MVPSSGTTPDLVAVEDDGQGGIWLRGLSSGCEQSWHTRVGTSSSGSGVDLVTGDPPDNLGGVVVLVQNNNYPGVYPATNSLIDINGTSGIPSWRYDSPGALVNQNPPAAVAVDQNGYILAVEDSYLSSNFQYSQANLIKLIRPPGHGWRIGACLHQRLRLSPTDAIPNRQTSSRGPQVSQQPQAPFRLGRMEPTLFK
jgi:hypothetical protein